MKSFYRCVSLIAVLAPLSSSAQDANLWAYSCDHFLHGACLRIPSGMSVNYEAPADFGLHRVQVEGREVVLVYEGDAPGRRPADTQADLKLTAPGYQLYAFKVSEGKSVRYDLHVSSAKSEVMPLHLVARTTGAVEQAALAAVLGGFRVCSFKRNRTDQTLVCPRRSMWGQALSEWATGKASAKAPAPAE